jgi:hypothetical protein
MDDSLIDTKSPTVSPPPSVTERRRPGRIKFTDRALIALLRNPTAAVVDDAPEIEQSDALAPTRGVLLGLLIGIVMWCAIGMIILRFMG